MKKSISIFMFMCLLSATACRPLEGEAETSDHSSAERDESRITTGRDPYEGDSTKTSSTARPSDTGDDDDDEPTKDRQQWRTIP